MATKNIDTPIFPFTAIRGQEEMKLALLLNTIDPRIGGVMVMGDRGTGKSTTIRAVIDLLPEILVVEDDAFNSSITDQDLMSDDIRKTLYENTKNIILKYKKVPMIDLPLGATEDRVCGTIDIEKALTKGIKAFEPGLLAKANRGILYVDEVNLLDDHLVDILLDSAASGWNTVEREGVSIKHPARFVLVGSGNPEEGELRPQLLDRFGMHAEIKTVCEASIRFKIVEERLKFDRNPEKFLDKEYGNLKHIRFTIKKAQYLLPKVKLSYEFRLLISKVCSELDIEGLRGDIVVNRAAKAHAALNNNMVVGASDIMNIIVLCLRHRLRKDPLGSTTTSQDKILSSFADKFDKYLPFFVYNTF
jgi:magnesium chelatase subunit I